jgi:hypothetical protein
MAYVFSSGASSRELRLLLQLEAMEMKLLLSLRQRLRQLLLDPNRAPKVIDRLFPTSHLRDAKAEAEHRRLVGETMFERRLQALELFDQTLKRADRHRRLELSASEADLWLHVLNDIRLVLGTELDIRDNDWRAHPVRNREEVQSYQTLVAITVLQESILEALGGG